MATRSKSSIRSATIAAFGGRKACTSANAYAINAGGVIVGRGSFALYSKAVVWPSASGAMILLDKFLTKNVRFTELNSAKCRQRLGRNRGHRVGQQPLVPPRVSGDSQVSVASPAARATTRGHGSLTRTDGSFFNVTRGPQPNPGDYSMWTATRLSVLRLSFALAAMLCCCIPTLAAAPGRRRLNDDTLLAHRTSRRQGGVRRQQPKCRWSHHDRGRERRQRRLRTSECGRSQGHLQRILPGPAGKDALGTNSSGVIVGSAAAVPARWSPTQNGYSFEPLPLLDGDSGGWPAAVNEAGAMVGISYAPTPGGEPAVSRAAYWSPNGTVVDLNALLPEDSPWLLAEATDINNSGQVVGRGQLNGVWRGFVLGLVTLEIIPVPLAPGATTNEAWEINDFGHVIGRVNDGISGGGPFPQGGWGYFWDGSSTSANCFPRPGTEQGCLAGSTISTSWPETARSRGGRFTRTTCS